jgi:hypothetical protein
MKLCFVSVNGPREPYLLDKPRIWLKHVPLRDTYSNKLDALNGNSTQLYLATKNTYECLLKSDVWWKFHCNYNKR